MKAHLLSGGVAVLMCVAGLAGCTADHELPTISGSPSSTVDLEAVAKAYYDCMTDAGIEMNLVANALGEVTVVAFGGNHAIEWRSPQGGSGIAVPTDGPQAPLTINVDIDQQQGAYLTIDGVDHTEAYGPVPG